MLSRTVLVTGACAGFGRAIAVSLAQSGSHIVLCARPRRTFKRTGKRDRTRLGREGVRACGKLKAIFDAIDSLPTKWTWIDLLVNNSELAPDHDPIHKGPWGDWQAMIETNLLGLVAITDALLSTLAMAPQADVVNLGSVAGDFAYGSGSIYCATKSAVKTFTDGLRMNLVHLPILVTLLNTESSRQTSRPYTL